MILTSRSLLQSLRALSKTLVPSLQAHAPSLILMANGQQSLPLQIIQQRGIRHKNRGGGGHSGASSGAGAGKRRVWDDEERLSPEQEQLFQKIEEMLSRHSPEDNVLGDDQEGMPAYDSDDPLSDAEDADEYIAKDLLLEDFDDHETFRKYGLADSDDDEGEDGIAFGLAMAEELGEEAVEKYAPEQLERIFLSAIQGLKDMPDHQFPEYLLPDGRPDMLRIGLEMIEKGGVWSSSTTSSSAPDMAYQADWAQSNTVEITTPDSPHALRYKSGPRTMDISPFLTEEDKRPLSDDEEDDGAPLPISFIRETKDRDQGDFAAFDIDELTRGGDEESTQMHSPIGSNSSVIHMDKPVDPLERKGKFGGKRSFHSSSIRKGRLERISSASKESTAEAGKENEAGEELILSRSEMKLALEELDPFALTRERKEKHGKSWVNLEEVRKRNVGKLLRQSWREEKHSKPERERQPSEKGKYLITSTLQMLLDRKVIADPMMYVHGQSVVIRDVDVSLKKNSAVVYWDLPSVRILYPESSGLSSRDVVLSINSALMKARPKLQFELCRRMSSQRIRMTALKYCYVRALKLAFKHSDDIPVQRDDTLAEAFALLEYEKKVKRILAREDDDGDKNL